MLASPVHGVCAGHWSATLPFPARFLLGLNALSPQLWTFPLFTCCRNRPGVAWLSHSTFFFE
jgi:hypothetical protein